MINDHEWHKDIIRYEKVGNGIYKPAISGGIAAVLLLAFGFICNFPDYIKGEADNGLPDHLSIIDNIDDKVTISTEARWKYMKLHWVNKYVSSAGSKG